MTLGISYIGGVRWEVERLRNGLHVAVTLSPWPFRRVTSRSFALLRQDLFAASVRLNPPLRPRQLTFTR